MSHIKAVPKSGGFVKFLRPEPMSLVTPIKWSDLGPIQPGWYLWKRKRDLVSNAELLLLVRRENGIRVSGFTEHFDRTPAAMRGQWIGPLAP